MEKKDKEYLSSKTSKVKKNKSPETAKKGVNKGVSKILNKGDYKKSENVESKKHSYSLTRLLRFVKIVEEEIKSDSKTSPFRCPMIVKSVKIENGISTTLNNDSFLDGDEFIKSGQSSLDKFSETFRKYFIVKDKIAETNSKTIVEICGDKRSIFGWITFKKYIGTYKRFYSDLLEQFAQSRSRVNKASEVYIENLESRKLELYKSNKSEQEINKLVKNFSVPEFKIISPVTEESVIRKLEEIKTLESFIDVELSEANAKTSVDLEFTI